MTKPRRGGGRLKQKGKKGRARPDFSFRGALAFQAARDFGGDLGGAVRDVGDQVGHRDRPRGCDLRCEDAERSGMAWSYDEKRKTLRAGGDLLPGLAESTKWKDIVLQGIRDGSSAMVTGQRSDGLGDSAHK